MIVAHRPTLPRLIGEAARLIPLSDVVETRGSLLPIDLADLPFRARRVFVVRGVPPGTTRGGHAHQRGAQLLVRLSGQIRVEVGAEGNSEPFLLADSRVGLLLPAAVWSSQTYLTADASLLVLCSEPYHPSEYAP